MDKHPSDWTKAPLRTQATGLLAALCVLAGVIGVSIFARRVAEATGPDLIARNDSGDVLLASRHTLYWVGSGGSTQVLPVAQLGLNGPLTSLAASGQQWYVGDDASGMLYRCELSRAECRPALQAAGGRRLIRRANDVLVTSDRIYVTDSERHRLAVFDRKGQPLTTTRTAPIGLCFPNGIVADGPHLYIADTNNLRIARIHVDEDYRSETFIHVGVGAPLVQPNCNESSSKLSDRGSPVVNTVLDSANTRGQQARAPARADRRWPASLLRASDGRWWVTQLENGMRDGDVVLYDDAGVALKRVVLPEDADPVNLAETAEGILITDASRMQIYRVSLDGGHVEEWGPPTLREAMQRVREERRRALFVKHAAVGMIGLGVALALLVVALELARQRRERWAPDQGLAPVSSAPAPVETRGVTWIALDAEADTRMQRAAWTLGIAMLLYSIGMAVLLARAYAHTKLAGYVTLMAFFAASAWALGVYVTWELVRSRRRRIGVGQTQVLFDRGNGSEWSSPWSDVLVSSNSILIGRHVVMLLDQRRRALFPREALDALLLSRVPASAYVGGWPFYLEALRRGNRMLWAAIFVVGLHLCTMLIAHFSPETTRALKELLKRLVS